MTSAVLSARHFLAFLPSGTFQLITASWLPADKLVVVNITHQSLWADVCSFACGQAYSEVLRWCTGLTSPSLTGPSPTGPGPSSIGPTGPGPSPIGPTGPSFTGPGPCPIGPTGPGPGSPSFGSVRACLALRLVVRIQHRGRNAFAALEAFDRVARIGISKADGSHFFPFPLEPAGSSWRALHLRALAGHGAFCVRAPFHALEEVGALHIIATGLAAGPHSS